LYLLFNTEVCNMVVAPVAFVNTSDLPEATVVSQRAARKTKQVFSKWNIDMGEEDSFDARTLDQPERPKLEALFPSFDPVLVQTIVAESATWEEALGVLLTLSDDNVQCEQRQRSIAKDPVTDNAGFPPLLDADGWEVVREAVLDVEDDGRVWCEVVKGDASNAQSMRGARLWETLARPSMLVQEGPLGNVTLEVGDQVELETEHDHRQRRGMERRFNQAKYSRRPACAKQTNTTKTSGKQVKSKDSEPPAWRLCRFEDRL
jgi:hypothetical protein